MEILRQQDKESAAAEAGEYLNLALMEHKKTPLLLMLSGGSALSILDYVGKTALGSNLTVSMLDERFSQDPAINNFSQLQKTDFYKDGFDAEVSFFGTLPRNGEDMEDLAKRWEANLRNWREKNPKGLIMATLGLGAEGHTAGIFPLDEEKNFNQIFKNDPWVAAYNVGDRSDYKERLTTTLTFFKLIDMGFAFVSGANKKSKLDQVASKKGQPHQLPALAWHEIKNITVFTDIAESK